MDVTRTIREKMSFRGEAEESLRSFAALRMTIHFCLLYVLSDAGVAKLVDALDLGSSEATRGGSNPSSRTIRGAGITKSPGGAFRAKNAKPLLRRGKVQYLLGNRIEPCQNRHK